MGALIETDVHAESYRKEHPGSLAYEMNVMQPSRKLTSVAALGAANDTAFANTALLPNTAKAAYDHQRINALFLPFDIQMTDKNGRSHKQTVIALAALDNLHAADNPTRQVRVDYGDGYLQQFDSLHEAAAFSGTEPLIKREPAES